jgi:hypothetical protein
LDGLVLKLIHYRRSKAGIIQKDSKSNTFYEGEFGNIITMSAACTNLNTQEMTLCMIDLEITQAKKREFICHNPVICTMLQMKIQINNNQNYL